MKSTHGNNERNWSFLTNHAQVLTRVGANPSLRLRDIAAAVGITERTAVQIVNDLERAGYLTKRRNGRRNVYEVHDELPLRHPQHRHHTVGDLIRFLQDPAQSVAGADTQQEAASP
jgi:hypothetical protein